MEKKKYKKTEMEFVRLTGVDVLTTSDDDWMVDDGVGGTGDGDVNYQGL